MDKELLLELINSKDECEWVEYKENWFDRDELGCYISALSNSAAEHGEEYAYFIWGVQDQTRTIVGTGFKYDVDIQGEPLKHYLARKLNPSIAFRFEPFEIEGKRIVCLSIPAASRIMTEFDKNRYIRIGSSKELLRKFPEREIDLAVILKNGIPTIVNTPSTRQDLSFSQLKSYYLSKGLSINPDSFEENLSLFVPGSRRFNELAFILSDENDITCRVSVFSGKAKSDPQYSLNDFGKKAILLTIDQILYFLESMNITRLDETNRVVERKDVPLFNADCVREAILNAFIHNDWVDLNAPMVSVFSDRIEILSYGSLPSKQTKAGFFAGKSKPRCRELAEIFLQLRISERSGRGVNKIVNAYGENAFEIAEDFIRVTIPFAFEREATSLGGEHKNGQESEQNQLPRHDRVIALILSEMRANPKVTTVQLMAKSGLSKTAIQNYLRELSGNGFIKRVGSNKGGHWEVID